MLPEPIHTKTELVDLDVHSLYPYAFTQISIPQGKPIQYSNDMNINEIEHGYLKIRVISIDAVRFPTITKLKLQSGSVIYLDIQTLKDLIEFEHLKYEVIKGYVYTKSAVSNELSDAIQMLYDLRSENRIFKLILNSMYGKLCQKPIKYRYFNYTDEIAAFKFVKRNYNSVVEMKRNDCYTTIKCLNDKSMSYSLVNIGCAILSKSKHIMNRWLQNPNLHVFYTDTDSIFIPKSDLKYIDSSDLGSGLGKLDNENGADVYSTESVFAAKKTYYLKLSDGNDKMRIIGVKKDEIKDRLAFFIAKYRKAIAKR